jgi:hypothetical protein
MKKQLFNALLIGLLAMPAISTRADVIDEGQTTEGKDFWVTFMQADQDPNNDLTLSLSISSREDCQVTIKNPFTQFDTTISVTANVMQPVELYNGNVLVNNARSVMETTGKVCYAVNSEQVDTCALHVTSTAKISLFATNYKRATFDATNVLPTPSLLDEYIIQTYTPSDHGGTEKTQGSHFAIIAAEDNTIVDYCPTVRTKIINDIVAKQNDPYTIDTLSNEEKILAQFQPGDTLHSPVLMKGQVYYVWTGKKDKEEGDLSGTYVKARDGKKIAVFQGCPHTNIPYQTKERDHIFSQAMPTKYWGNTFVLTASAGRHKDFVRILALNDETEVRINGNLVHTFDFANTDKKQYWEFTIGDQGTYAQNGSCVVTTSCPCATHLFLASKKADNVENGDPAMLWVNPIEQQIDQVTFATYSSKNGTTAHYVNVVTDQPDLMTLTNGTTPVAMTFNPVDGSTTYSYAQVSLGSQATSYTLKSNGSNFIAHVYGFTSNESYGYSAGGATVPLSQSIYINGEEFSPEKENKLCGIDTVRFACKPDFMPDSVVWHFGDNTPDVKLIQDTTTVVPHYYQNGGTYDASCTIYRSSSNICVGQSAKSVIPITVIIGRYTFSIGDPDIPCPEGGVQAPGRIPYTSTIDLTGDHVHIGFDADAQAAGFDSTTIGITPTDFLITIPKEAQTGVPYGITIKIESSCGDTTATMLFSLPVGNDVIDQRYSNVLGILKDHKDLEGMELSDFQWYRKSDSTALAGQVSSNLNMYDLPAELYEKDAFYVCYTINKGKADQRRSCACAKEFMPDSSEQQFDMNPDAVTVTAYYVYGRDNIFVNADWNGKTDIECYAQWITVSGDIYQDLKFNIPDGGCTIPVPAENGLYLLRVRTDGKNRSFKFFINH